MAALLASVAIGYLVQHHSSTGQRASVTPQAAATTPAPPALAAPPLRPARHAAAPHERVAPAAPNAFEIKGAAFDIKANVCEMDYVRPLDPPGDQVHTVCWVRKDFGVAPGSKSAGTSYILGHSWAQSKLVFNPLSELATSKIDTSHPLIVDGIPTYPVKVLDGYRITMRTPNGTLTYRVTRTFAVTKARAGDIRSVMANTPDRVVLITCAVGGGADLDYNIIVYATLVSSVAAHHATP